MKIFNKLTGKVEVHPRYDVNQDLLDVISTCLEQDFHEDLFEGWHCMLSKDKI